MAAFVVVAFVVIFVVAYCLGSHATEKEWQAILRRQYERLWTQVDAAQQERDVARCERDKALRELKRTEESRLAWIQECDAQKALATALRGRISVAMDALVTKGKANANVLQPVDRPVLSAARKGAKGEAGAVVEDDAPLEVGQSNLACMDEE